MADIRLAAAAEGIAVQLLDAAQGHPVQTWRFADPKLISIGRDANNDIVISDPLVSRIHVRLVRADDAWTLHSLGRHGTLVSDRLIAEASLASGATFRLGPQGPMLRFVEAAVAERPSETIDSIQPDLLELLRIDEERAAAEVAQVASGDLFKQLLEQSSQRRHGLGGSAASMPLESPEDTETLC